MGLCDSTSIAARTALMSSSVILSRSILSHGIALNFQTTRSCVRKKRLNVGLMKMPGSGIRSFLPTYDGRCGSHRVAGGAGDFGRCVAGSLDYLVHSARTYQYNKGQLTRQRYRPPSA